MRSSSLTHACCFSIALALAACNIREVAEVPAHDSREESVKFPVAVNGQIDLLFIVDDSNSMAAEQSSLVAGFATMLAPLEELEGGLPSMHIGVISTDVGAGSACRSDDRGELQHADLADGDPCAGLTGSFIVDEPDGDGGRNRNYQGALGDTFQCMAARGVTGCGFEQPLASLRRALDPETAINPGFLRDNAMLAIVILSDEDDCSAVDDALFVGAAPPALEPVLGYLTSFRCFEFGVTCDGDTGDPRALGPRQSCAPRDDSPYLTPIDELVGFVKSLKPAESQLVVAGILGAPGPIEVVLDPQVESNGVELPVKVADSCPSPSGDPSDDGADPPIRLDAFLSAFDQNVRASICDADLSPAMEDIGAFISDRLHRSCLDGALVDADPETDGLQPDCVTSEVQFPGTDAAVEHALPSCSDVADPLRSDVVPCYLIQPDPAQCPETTTQLAIEVYYPEGAVRPYGTLVDTRCSIE